MKKKILLALMIISSFSQAQETDKLIINYVLCLPEIKELLWMHDLKDRGPIRIVDNTGLLAEQYIFLKCPDVEGAPLNGAVLSQIPMNFNTGYFRDLCIFKAERDNDTFMISMFVAQYLCTYNKKTEYTITLKFRISEGKLQEINREMNLTNG